jgi:hypothetical protein
VSARPQSSPKRNFLIGQTGECRAFPVRGTGYLPATGLLRRVKDREPAGGTVYQPVVSVIAVGPDETVPSGIPWESVHLPSLQTDEVKT